MHMRPDFKTKVPRPEFKLGDLKRAVGKTIVDVEFGEEKTHKDCHEAEAIVLHFSDGKSLSITVGSNVGNLGLGAKFTEASDLSTDLMVHWLKESESMNPALNKVT